MQKKRLNRLFFAWKCSNFVLILSITKYIIIVLYKKNKEVWKMKKKIAIICAAVMLVMSFSQSVGAINVIMNSALLEFPDQEPVIENGTTLVPIRAVAEALGLEVTWDDATDTVVLKKDNFYVELVIGSTVAKTSAGVKKLAVAPKIINGRTMVPLRFIAEEMGLIVLWNDEYQRVIINGQVDTQTAPIPPAEEPTGEAPTAEGVETATDTAADEVVLEEETEAVPEIELTMITTPNTSLLFEIPDTYLPEDTDDEQSFAYRSLDGFDAQHKYNWEIVSQYECYADEDAKSGIIFIVQELEPYEGEEFDVARASDDYPEAPERVEFDYEYIFSEIERLIVEQICAEKEIEVPEGYEEMEDEDLAIALGFESGEEMNAYMETVDTQALLYEIPEYVEFAEYQQANGEYRREVNEINNARNYAIRHFDRVYEELDDETWAMIFSSNLNSDIEVRYESVEVIDFEGKKVVHAVIYAEDPDDEQGTYEYYRYQDGDTLVTIFGGTLFESEASLEVSEILANMIIQ